MIFIVASNSVCASTIARREGISSPRDWCLLTSLTMHRIRGMEDPQVWIADCGLEMLTEGDKDMIISRRSRLSRVGCGG